MKRTESIKRKRWLQKTALVLGVGFIVYGVFREEVHTVFSKAIRICLECIGIG